MFLKMIARTLPRSALLVVSNIDAVTATGSGVRVSAQTASGGLYATNINIEQMTLVAPAVSHLGLATAIAEIIPARAGDIRKQFHSIPFTKETIDQSL